MSKIVLLSDIHGNLTALKSVFNDLENRGLGYYKIAFLGDSINYGMRSEEVINFISGINKSKFLVNLRGNHENALFDFDQRKFSSKRGLNALEYTEKLLSKESLNYIKDEMQDSLIELAFNDKKILFVHGNYGDSSWGKMSASEMLSENYKSYDFVFFGHSHIPELKEIFYKKEDSEFSGKSKTIFINPGSVGQPRNHNYCAQYAVVDIVKQEYLFYKVGYDVNEEIILYNGEIDFFYAERLKKGI